MMHQIATDIPSKLSEVLCGGHYGHGTGYGLNAGNFAELSETLPVCRPELNTARTGIIDYFDNT